MDEWINAIGSNDVILKYSLSDDEKIIYCHCPFCNFINIYDSDRMLFSIKGNNLIYSILTDDIVSPAKDLICFKCKTIFKITSNKYIIVDNTKIMEKINAEKEKKDRLDIIYNCNLAELAKMEEQKKEEEEKAFIEAGKPQNIIGKMYKDVKKQTPVISDEISREDSETPKKYSFKFVR